MERGEEHEEGGTDTVHAASCEAAASWRRPAAEPRALSSVLCDDLAGGLGKVGEARQGGIYIHYDSRCRIVLKHSVGKQVFST